MDISEKRYPYPVLKVDGDDYVGSRFDVEVEVRDNSDKITLVLRPTLKDDGLRQLIANRSVAAIVCHVESPQTAYRVSVPVALPNCETATDEEVTCFDIPATQLSGPVSVCPFIVAVKDIVAYSNDSFNPDYDGEAQNIWSGGILAEGSQFRFFVESTPTESRKMSSVIIVIAAEDPKLVGMRVNVAETDKISVLLPKATFARYRPLQSAGNCEALLRAMIFVPALVEVICYVKSCKRKDPTLVDIASAKWFRALDAALKRSCGHGFESERFNEDSCAAELAAVILKDPLTGAFESITKGEAE